MQRVDTSTAAPTLPAQGAPGTPGYFTQGDPAAPVPATVPGQDWFNAVQEELIALILAAGLTPDKPTLTQVRDAVRILAGVRTTTAAADNTLSAASAGLVRIDASAGPVTLTLPAASDRAGSVFRFVRIDASANTVTVQAAPGDAIDGAPSFSLSGANIGRTIMSDGDSDWYGARFIRADADDQVAGIITFADHPGMANNIALRGRNAADTGWEVLIQLNGANEVHVGTTARPLVLRHDGTLQEVGGGTIWHSNNLDPADFATADHDHVTSEVGGQNPAQVTVTGSPTTVVDVPLGTLSTAEDVEVWAQVTFAKNGAAGSTTIEVLNISGDGTLVFTFNQASIRQSTYSTTGDSVTVSLHGLARVTGQGSITLRLRAWGDGSDSIVSADAGELYARVKPSP